jgi:intracellular multiplication protein IcmO
MFRGLDKRHEQDARQLLRDTRTLGQRVHDFFLEPRNVAIVLIVMAVAVFFLAAVADIIFIVGLCLFVYTAIQHPTLPYRMPMRSGMLDYNDLIPGTNKARKAKGICFFGNDIQTNEELWFSNDDMRTHVLIFGSTGSGKTEALISIAFNALVQSSGFIYVDGKGDNSLFAKIFSMARSVGREDDILVINFMTGAKDIIGPQAKRLSNTMNPFSSGSSSMLSQLVISLMDSSGNSSDGDMWKGRAIGFVEALMRVLVYMRDDGKILLDANSVRNYFALDRLESMTMDKMFIRDGEEPVSLAHVPSSTLEPIYNYVINLPGYNKQKKGKQVSQVLEQHGFITMQLTRVFTSLADTYGHILRTNLAEVDLKDVVLNRRILIVLLPALEKSPDELSNLGKVIIASLKAMMAAGLGEAVEGSYKDNILKKPTNAPTPFMCIMDEYGYYAVPGFAVVPAQARSLGFSAIFAGQDLPAFQKASKEEALSIGANTNIKIAMKLEDPIETWDFFQKTAGEAYVTKVDAFQTNASSVFNNYLDTRSASSERRQRIDLLDLKEQREGEAHIFFRSTIIRAKLFYANPAPVPWMRLNHFVKVERPDIKELVAFERRLEGFAKMLKEGDFQVVANEPNTEIEMIASVYKEKSDKPLIEKGVAALIAYYNKTTEPELEEEEIPEEIQAMHGELNVYQTVVLPPLARSLLSESTIEEMTQPLLLKAPVQQQVEFLVRMLGKNSQYARNVGKELVGDIGVATQYPPVVEHVPEPDDVIEKVDALIESFKTMVEGSDGGDEGSGELDDL